MSFCIRGEIVSFELYEGKDKVNHTVTPKEEKLLQDYQQKRWGRIPVIPKYDYIFNGKLAFNTKKNSYIRDTNKNTLEIRLADVLIQLVEQSEIVRIERIPTEEATKMSLIVPFFQMLGYDVFNPDEFLPEFTADVGIKKGEKVDYAIMRGGVPVILIECKWCGENLDKHSSQLFRYFGTSTAKFGILTNGLDYKFYTDLDESNKMDLTPFLEFDILNVKSNIVTELKKFSRDSFDVDNIFSTASELKYSKAIKLLFANQLKEPTDDFIKYFLSGIYEGVKTQNVVDKFRGIIKKSLNDYISEMMNDKISSALKTDSETSATIEEPLEIKEETALTKIHTTGEEIESFYIVKSMLVGIINAEDITYKDNERYFSILYNGNIRKPICRINLDTKKKQIMIPDDNKDFSRTYFDSINDIYSFKDDLIKAVSKYIDNKPN